MLIFSISFPDLIKIPYFMDTPEREGFGGERRPKDRVTLQIILVLTLTQVCKCKNISIYTATG
jgi:hypothetical protein